MMMEWKQLLFVSHCQSPPRSPLGLLNVAVLLLFFLFVHPLFVQEDPALLKTGTTFNTTEKCGHSVQIHTTTYILTTSYSSQLLVAVGSGGSDEWQ